MKRRRFLALCGVGTSGALAGCSGDSRPSAPSRKRTTVAGPAKFGDVIIQTANSAGVGQRVTLTVSAFNYGGETGTFTDRLVAVEGGIDLATDVRIADVPSGERGRATIDMRFDGAGRYRFRLADADVYASVTVVGERAEPGEPLTVGHLRLSVSNVDYETDLFYRFDDGSRSVTDLVGASPEEALAVVRGTVKNVGDRPAVFDPSAFSVAGGEFLTEVDGRPLDTVRIDGRPLAGARVASGSAVSGWILLRLRRDRALAGPELGWQAEGNADSAPEKRWALPAAEAFPSFELDAFEVPDRQSAGWVNYELRVRNGGDVGGTYRGAVSHRTDGWGWRLDGVQEAYIESGAARTFSGRTLWPYVDAATWRVEPFNAKRDGSFEALSVPFGEAVPVADASTAAVRNPRFADSYLYEVTVTEEPEPFASALNNSSSASTEPVERVERRIHTPRDVGDGKFLLVDVETRAGADGARVAQEDAFTVVVGGRTFEVDHAYQPVEPPIDLFEVSGGTRSGQPIRGTLIFGVPNSASIGDVAVRYREDYSDVSVEATWRRQR